MLFFTPRSDLDRRRSFYREGRGTPTLIKRRGSWIEVTQLCQVGNGKATHALFHSPFESRASARAAARRRDSRGTVALLREMPSRIAGASPAHLDRGHRFGCRESAKQHVDRKSTRLNS